MIPFGIIAKYYFSAKSIIPVLLHKNPFRIGNYGRGKTTFSRLW